MIKYKNLKKTQAEYAAKEIKKKTRKVKKILKASSTAKKVIINKEKHDQKHKSCAGADVLKPKIKIMHMG